MIRTVLWTTWINMKRDRVALLLTFVLPLVFFSIFASIFGNLGGGGGGGGGRKIVSLVADLDQSEVSTRLVAALMTEEALAVTTAAPPVAGEGESLPFDRATAHERVRGGQADVAVVIPEGFGAAFGFGVSEVGGTSEIELIYDAANPIARPTVAGLLQASAMRAAPDVLMSRGLEQLEDHGGILTDEQRRIVDAYLPMLRDESVVGGDRDGGGSSFAGLVAVHATDARAGDAAGEPRKKRSMVAYYAAGISVMFLLFSMTGAASSVLEEEESGVLERLLTSNVTMSNVLVGKWLFYSLLGAAQLCLMFLWGSLVFGLELFTGPHLAGFLAMTLVTAPAAAAFGLLLASLCRSRGQLNGVSTIVILIMSALGGSMVPRFVMPAFMRTTSLFTFNGWALDGYLEVFWYDDPTVGVGGALLGLIPQLLVLSVAAVVLLAVARFFARRWETV